MDCRMLNAECRMKAGRAATLAAAALLALSLVAHGCHSANSATSPPLDPTVPATDPADAGTAANRIEAREEARADARPRKGRAQLWAENCQRCHNARPASWYSEREWEVAMHHMFVRGYLTRREYDSVMEFFRAAR